MNGVFFIVKGRCERIKEDPAVKGSGENVGFQGEVKHMEVAANSPFFFKSNQENIKQEGNENCGKKGVSPTIKSRPH